MVTHTHDRVGPEREAVAGRLGNLAWGAFFLWLGIAFLADVGVGVGLIGVAVITLVVQLARRSLHLPVEGFWVVAGACFLLGGLWDLLGIGLPLIPILLVLAGLAIIVPQLVRRRTGGRQPDR